MLQQSQHLMKTFILVLLFFTVTAQAQWLGNYAVGDSVSFSWTNVDSTISLAPIAADTAIVLRFRQPTGASPVLVDSTIYHSATTPTLASLERGAGHYVFRAKASDGSNTQGIYYVDIKGWDYINSKRVYGLFRTYSWSCGGSYNEVRLVSSDSTTPNLDNALGTLSDAQIDDITVASVSGTVNANLITWKGSAPNELRSGGVDIANNDTVYAGASDPDTVAAHVWTWSTRTLTSGAGTGSNQVTVTVKSSADSSVLNGVQVQVLNQTQTATEGLLTTNSLGEAVFALNDATYKVRLFKPGYVFTVPESVVVSGNTSVVYYGSAFNPGTPPSPALCRVYGYVKDINNLPVVGAKVEALNKTVPLRYQSVVISPYYKTTVTDNNGYWYLDLFPNVILTPADSKYRFNIHVPSGSVLRLETEVPNQSSWELTF